VLLPGVVVELSAASVPVIKILQDHEAMNFKNRSSSADIYYVT
jgi:hypothetical protein